MFSRFPTPNASMPKLTPIQWLIFFFLLVVYTFAVFALTRDYYLRHPVKPKAVATTAPHGKPSFVQQVVRAESIGNDPIQLNQTADALFAQGRYREAIPYYQRLRQLTPGDREVDNDLGLALHYSGKTGDALAVLREAVQQAPEFQRLWLSLGFVSASAQQLAEARQALEKAKALNPNNGIGQEAARLLDRLQEKASATR